MLLRIVEKKDLTPEVAESAERSRMQKEIGHGDRLEASLQTKSLGSQSFK
jgi:hypothetical protein